MNLKYIGEATKSCPICGMATMKNEGCNKMTCTNCGKHWCWKCNQVGERLVRECKGGVRVEREGLARPATRWQAQNVKSTGAGTVTKCVWGLCVGGGEDSLTQEVG